MESRVKDVETEDEGEQELQQGSNRKVKAEPLLLLPLVERRGGGPSTPPPTWKLELSSHEGDGSTFPTHHRFLPHHPPSASRPSNVSARKLCATLWEVLPYPWHSMSRQAAKPRWGKGFDFVPPDELESGGGIQKQNLGPHFEPQRPRGNGPANLPMSSASYCSSMEVAPYKPSVTSVSSLDWRGQTGESSCSLQTSTELLKILNRIWSLEEQHVSNKSVAKALRSELARSRARIKELLREKDKDKHVVSGMMKRVEEDKVREVEARVKSVRRELEEERKLRRFSENERKKLTKELSVLKSGFSTALGELERERKARVLLEGLCDEFAEGIRDYDVAVRSLKHKVSEGSVVSGEGSDRSILHISEAWLDERIQMKLARTRKDVPEKDTIVDRLSPDIKTFLRAKRHDSTLGEMEKDKFAGRHSLESFQLNEAASAPKFPEEEISVGSDLHLTERTDARELKDGLNRVPCGGITAAEVVDMGENQQGSDHPKLLLNHSLSLKGEGSQIHRRRSSPVQPWKFKLSSPDFDQSESSSLLPPGVKENTLMAKLLEARLESQHSRTRASKRPA